MKAVFITDAGVLGYNLTSDSLTEIKLDDYLDDSLQMQLLACVVARTGRSCPLPTR